MLIEVDVVTNTEDHTGAFAMARTPGSIGVCAAGMRKTVQSRNLGEPVWSRKGMETRNGWQVSPEAGREVRLPDSTGEVR
jgi:hypothetical protein